MSASGEAVEANRPEQTTTGLLGRPAAQANVIEMVRRSCELQPSKPAVVFEDGVEVTRQALLDGIERFAGYLTERIGPGDRVVVCMGNRAEFFIATFAIIAVRGTVVPLNPAAGPVDGGHILRDSATVLAIADAEGGALLDRIRGDCPDLGDVIVLDGSEPYALPVGHSALLLSESGAQPSDLAALYYTSGTTGRPKGCMIDHEWIYRNAVYPQEVYPMGPEDRLLSCLRFHYSDPTWQLLMMLTCGGVLIAMRNFSASRYWDVVRRHGATILQTTSTIPAWLLKQPPSDSDHEHEVRFCMHSAIPADRHVELEERWGFPWLECYALMETGVVTLMPIELNRELRGRGSVGLPVHDVAVRVVAEDGSDRPPGELGEIVMQGPGVFLGYLNNPSATEEACRGGWLHTGDIGRLDDKGRLYYASRKKEIIRRSGENIVPGEVEDVLRSHPLVLDAAVVPRPDEDRGEEVLAHVRVQHEDAVAPQALVEFCAERLTRFKVPRFIKFHTNDFPRTASLRPRKREIVDAPPLWDHAESKWL